MPTNKKPPAKTRVQAIHPTLTTTETPGDWRLNTSFGHMACDKTPAGRLVRLADVLRWIESTQLVPRVEALQVFCEAIPPDIMQWLYWIQPGDYAKPVPLDHGFGYKSAERIKKDEAAATQAAIQREWQHIGRYSDGFASPGRFFQSNGGQVTASPIIPTEPGLPALLKALNRSWSTLKFNRAATVDILDEPRIPQLTPLAITLEKAAALWGYGHVLTPVASTPETFAELVAFRKANTGTPWVQDQREILRREVAARVGQTGIRKEIAAALGISVSFVGGLLAKKYESKRAQSPQLRSVGG